jgi:hypothetical protein
MAHRRVPKKGEQGSREADMLMLTGPGIVVAAAIVIVAIWTVVLLGSRFFGPQ